MKGGNPMRSPRRNLFDAASNLDGPPQGGAPEAWVYGVGLALPTFAYGLFCLLMQRAWFLNIPLRGVPRAPGMLREWSGRSAMAFGVVLIAVAAFAHFHWFWSNSPRLSPYYEIGKIVSLILLIGALGWWVFEALW
jgi:hypothetical protein